MAEMEAGRSPFDAGNALFRKGDFAGAVERFTRALASQPNDERVWSNRCAAFLRLGDIRAAEVDAARCVELAPRWHKAHFRVGRVLHDRGELVRAWESYYAAHILEPDAPLYPQMMASVEAQLSAPGASAEAIEGLRALKLRILKVDPMGALTAGGDPAARVPVTVLSGFLGAGKSSLLRHVLRERHGLRVAVIVNDMAELNIDAQLVRDAGSSVVRADDRLVEMSNGCICCTLREDLLNEVAALCLSGRFDAMLIESSGISEPTPVAQTFLFEDALGRSLAHLARLDTLVTVVDAERFALDLSSADGLAQRGLGATPEDARGIGQLLISQVECADVLVLNKADLASEAQLGALGARLAALNPRALQVRTVHGRAPLPSVLATGLFTWQAAMAAPGWLPELSAPAGAHATESETYGIRSFVYTRARPFDGAKLRALMEERRRDGGHCLHASRLLRSKGFCWLAEAPALRLEWATAAADFMPRVSGCWLGALAEACQPDSQLVAAVAEAEGWDARYADRRTQLVLIGVGLVQADAEAALDSALLPYAQAEALDLSANRPLPSEPAALPFANLLGPILAQLGAPPCAAAGQGEHLRTAAASGTPGEGTDAAVGDLSRGGCGSGGWPGREAVEARLIERLSAAAGRTSCASEERAPDK